MKRFSLIAGIALVAVFLVLVLTDGAIARRHHKHFHFGIVIAPPIIWWAPYPYYYEHWRPPFDPPPRYFREWVPGRWEWRWDPYCGCWRRIWVPGYWEYRPDDP